MRFDPERHAHYLVPAGLALAVLGLCFGGPIMWVCLAFALSLLVLAAYSRDDGLLIFGPFVRHDLVMFARRYRLALWRSLYAGMLLGILAWLYAVLLQESSGSMWSGSPSIREVATFSSAFFGTFMAIQALTIVTLAPGFLGEVIAEEKDRNRLDFLLATDLRNREIVLGKIASRLAYMFSIVLVGLPVLALLPLFGGVDPYVTLALSAATLATLLGITGLAIFASVFSRTAKQAVSTVNGLALLYLTFSGLLWIINAYPMVASYPMLPWGSSTIRVIDLVEWINFGNPVSMGVLIGMDSSSGRGLEAILDERVRQYACFHLLVLAVFGLTGTAMLRRVAAMQASGPISRPATKSKDLVTPGKDQPVVKAVMERPEVTDRPVLWKEIHFNSFRPKSTAQVFMLGIVGLFAISPIAAMIGYGVTGEYTSEINLVTRILTGAIAMAFFLHTAQIGARSIARERDKDTYESLILTGMGTREILIQKWLGVYATSRVVFYWLIVNWLVAVAVGALHVLAVPLLILAVLIYQAFATSLGIWVSVRSATVQKANKLLMWWVMGIPGIAYLSFGIGQTLFPQDLLGLLAIIELPPLTIGMLGFSYRDFENISANRIVSVGIGAALSLILFGVLAKRLWDSALKRFEKPPEKEEVPSEPKAHLS